MKFKANEKDFVEVELGENDLGLANLIAKRLLESKGVSFAAAKMDHPLSGKPVLQIKAKDPEKELSKAVESVRKELEVFGAALAKARERA
ncbi:MAG: hypothetical protein NTY90_03285 [Candidatus Micrarchaeota archaeon]|nr:hypothetical protein [Candidatus Micrarchaeota archaeon]